MKKVRRLGLFGTVGITSGMFGLATIAASFLHQPKAVTISFSVLFVILLVALIPIAWLGSHLGFGRKADEDKKVN